MTPGMWQTLGERAPTWPGRNWPLGATWTPEATNFAVYSPHAEAVWLCLFDEDGGERRLPLTEQSLGIWHGAVPGVQPGDRYGYRVDGRWAPTHGLRFNPNKLLLDPYGLAVAGTITPGPALLAHDAEDRGLPSTLDSADATARSVVVDPAFDWEGDAPMKTRWRDTVIYEVHTKGFTQLHDRIPEHLRGTYAALGHSAVTDYLKDLGVTAVELLPVHQFFSEPALTDRGLGNYWGYNSISYFAPDASYSASGDRGGQVREFKQMVKDLHRAGLEVILDVVYNHTAEAGPDGPSISFRGFDDRGFYRRVPPNGGPTTVDDADPLLGPFDDTYWDVTGCGNTVNAEDPLALRLILDSLRYWVTEMHVDGFRFDLMSALTRTGDATGAGIDMACRLLIAIGQDPVLRHVKLIAEPWDASMDGYLVGRMPPPWVEWNDQYRDTIRDFWRGRSSGLHAVATRLAGSSDLYADDGRSAYNSVNFVTAHDGFTLRDLVSYDHKHNEANGEENRDGSDNNRSWNHGVEGETDDADIVALRRRQAANLMATLCLSNGVPMLTAGDERGRTQRGNNNAYCQDNEISWVRWQAEPGADGEPEAWLDVYQITRAALRLRRDHPALRQRHWFEGRPTIADGPKDLAWLHPTGREMTPADWHDHGLQTLGMFLSGRPLRAPGPRGEQQVDSSFLLWYHAGPDPVDLFLPDNDWVARGTVALSTDPDLACGTEVSAGESLRISGRSVVVLQES
ncbi:glycogen debranching protein GlgX [Nocardioides sp. GY 10113]|uniref:glycogen debranching protein GlgX n=1 Tax=Nocardioides sp. GY 10113 TaxID=2569761 RepID=UPI0010A7F63A|nr:glycogen debranching protein GlgX [Nocardioides sp. GY 10113]TIC79748.1 glycogen debranching protein GlgX [Nocardioides sp. GY 10113]TIC84924.1 glycogen debranching protein GlgX [Nocardioides sp. GY 10113]